MAISYTWDCKTCDTYPTKSSKSNVVHNVHWKLIATDDTNNDADGNPQTARAYSTQTLDTSNLSSFINWSSLTNNDVQGWVETAIGSEKVTALKLKLDEEIAKKVSASSVKKVIG